MLSKKYNLRLLVVLALIFRLVSMSFFYHPDLRSQHFHAQFLSQGVINIYQYLAQHRDSLPYTDTFNYPPPTYFFLGGWQIFAKVIYGQGLISWLNDWGPQALMRTGIFAYLLFLKIPYLFADALILKLGIDYLVEKKQKIAFTYLWLLNPISLYVVYMIGQFDIIPTAATVAALVLLLRQKISLSLICLAIGAVFKTYPLLLMPFIIIRAKNPKDFITFISSIIFSLLLTLPFSQASLTERIFQAGIDIGSGHRLLIYIVGYFLILLLSYSRRFQLDLLPEFLTTTSLVIAFSHFHPQWIMWTLPFLALSLIQKPNLRFSAILATIGFIGTILLIPDQYVFAGLFIPLNPYLASLPSLASLLKAANPQLLQNIFHSLLTISLLWIIVHNWIRHETI